MSREDRQEMLELAYGDWLMMINNNIPPVNARKLIYYDYELLEKEKTLLESLMLRELEGRYKA